VEAAFEIAALASDGKVENLPRLIEALGDSSEPVRWWAAQGCTILGKEAAGAEGALLKCLSDQSGAVAVAAAEALAHSGISDAALAALERRLQPSENAGVIQQAANVLDRLGEIARPLLPAMKRAVETAPSTPNGKYPPQFVLHHAIDVLEGKTAAFVYPAPISSADSR
jgi:HEAT repeat protein